MLGLGLALIFAIPVALVLWLIVWLGQTLSAPAGMQF
jgi:hypothetical protein